MRFPRSLAGCLLAILGVGLAFGSALAEIIPASEVVWPQPKPPEGTNPAEFALPRQDWVGRVESALGRTKGKHFDLIFDGDSITDGWQGYGKNVWAARYAPLNAVDFGISGDKVEHVLWRLKQGQGAEADPKLVVLMIGTNNTGRAPPTRSPPGLRTSLRLTSSSARTPGSSSSRSSPGARSPTIRPG